MLNDKQKILNRTVHNHPKAKLKFCHSVLPCDGHVGVLASIRLLCSQNSNFDARFISVLELSSLTKGKLNINDLALFNVAYINLTSR